MVAVENSTMALPNYTRSNENKNRSSPQDPGVPVTVKQPVQGRG
jgi:hypothetical protein